MRLINNDHTIKHNNWVGNVSLSSLYLPFIFSLSSFKIERFFSFIFFILVGVFSANATPSGLNKKEFGKYWQIESESADYKVVFRGDTCEVTAPKGLTLWRKEKMRRGMAVEYDVCIVDEGGASDRVSDMNAFWMASDAERDDIWQRAAWRNGVFLRCYTLQMYYLGYGGNYNKTTRFRRYDGDARGVEEAEHRPAILKEYTDEAHLLKGNHWYHVRIESEGSRTRFFVDGTLIVDYNDPAPLNEGWFGFRTTWSRFRITNFKSFVLPTYTDIPLHWVGETPQNDRPIAFGVPFKKGELNDVSRLNFANDTPCDTWINARWDDGSIKWAGVSAVIPAGNNDLKMKIGNRRKTKAQELNIKETSNQFVISTGKSNIYISRSGLNLIDSICIGNKKIGGAAKLIASTTSLAPESLISNIENVSIERCGKYSCVVKIEGRHEKWREESEERRENTFSEREDKEKITGRKREEKETLLQTNNVQLSSSNGASPSSNGANPSFNSTTPSYNGASQTFNVQRSTFNVQRQLSLPFVVRLYFFANSEQIKMVHTFVFDGDAERDFINSLGIRFDVPMREQTHNRHVSFACEDGGVWSEPIKPLDCRREIGSREAQILSHQMSHEQIPDIETFDERNQKLINALAEWDGFRLSQLTDNAYSVRKRATNASPWIGTFTGSRATGYVFLGDTSGGLGLWMKDFWQSYPSTIEINGARTDTASATLWLWSPEAEPMNLCHYDTIAHTLEASYEDVQPGMSSPYGIARTTTLYILPQTTYPDNADVAATARQLTNDAHLVCTPEYLHEKHAFGIWSLKNIEKAETKAVEERLQQYIDFYETQVEQHKWYGFWNYGDFMHAYNPQRHSWRYDVGGYAWDNTELASPSWLWYSFLRSGDAKTWRMAEAMTRHNGEVDCYHIGKHAALGSRHNVSHWGCGAKEARISQAAFNRFYYYLTTDERVGDLMTEVRDADTLLYHLDPMRLAEPRSKFPCTAPARLRIGPDWLAYVSNWMTEWERTGNTHYRDKIVAGMKSIAALKNGLFTGNKALGYDPATGILSYQGDENRQNTNHLMTIMGGFETMNELMEMVNVPEFNRVWLQHAEVYKQKARELSKNKFPVRRLMAYAAQQNNDPDMAKQAWNDLWNRIEHAEAPKFAIKNVAPPLTPATQTEWNGITTNDAALWSLDAIYMLEVIAP